MSTDALDAGPPDRLVAMDLEDGRVIIYDQDNDDAWVQSDLAIEIPHT